MSGNISIYAVPSREQANIPNTSSEDPATFPELSRSQQSLDATVIAYGDVQAEEIQQNDLYSLFRPLLIIMRLGGMFFIQPKALTLHHRQTDEKTINGNHSSDRRYQCQLKLELFERFSKAYCLLTFFMMWVYAARFLYSFHYGVSQLTFSRSNLGNIVGHSAYAIWIVQVILVHFLMLRACWNKSEMFRLFLSWKRFQFQCPLGNCQTFAQSFRRRRNVLCSVCGVNMILTVFVMVAPVVIPYVGFSELKHAVMEGFREDNTGVLAIGSVGAFFAMCIFTVPSYFFLMIGLALAINFWHLSHDLGLGIRKNGTLMGKSLEWFRIRHSYLCSLLEVADDIFAPWIVLNLGCSTIQVLAAIFGIYARSGSSKIFSLLSTTYWLGSYFVQMTLTLYTGTIVHTAAHAPLKHLYKIDQTKITISDALHLQTFLNKLSCTSIGFTAGKMFTINCEAVLAVFGAYVTYQIMLFELQLDLGLGGKIDTVGVCVHDAENERNLTLSY